MTPLRLVETRSGKFSLLLDAGTTKVDGLVAQLGHEPNGYFWEGVARFLVKTEAPDLDGRFSYDPEAGMFCAYGEDRAALQELAEVMLAVIADGDRMRGLVASAESSGFEFDD
ncbi:immunity protein 51 of polymorphic toxin system [Actinomadura pelletieri DSM 43383]|uniref:Immunity protein 51 of polymorphic toxin system n=1 Tax=Actinomadura pelletieri DSM 43383 TaxID=1120940 RepID=A0A495R072_9ACTN|nr:immunity 51 family protein [Actinomadura pelletieri]RKS79883.1 immunity protein 51 of polymorphic toxin system [Actinomadura pelletieri DSM 43383]